MTASMTRKGLLLNFDRCERLLDNVRSIMAKLHISLRYNDFNNEE